MFERITALGRIHEVTFMSHDILSGFTYVTVRHDYGESSIHESGLSVEMTIEQAEEWLKTLPEYEEISDPAAEQMALISELSEILTDEQAELFPQAYPEWKSSISYAVGKRVRYDGKLYRCVQAHTSQEGWEPPSVPALWVRTASEGEIPEWVQPTGAQDAYNTDDKVTHNGQTWVSIVDSNVWEPGVYGWDAVVE